MSAAITALVIKYVFIIHVLQYNKKNGVKSTNLLTYLKWLTLNTQPTVGLHTGPCVRNLDTKVIQMSWWLLCIRNYNLMNRCKDIAGDIYVQNQMGFVVQQHTIGQNIKLAKWFLRFYCQDGWKLRLWLFIPIYDYNLREQSYFLINV